jgi:hypothetical protein
VTLLCCDVARPLRPDPCPARKNLKSSSSEQPSEPFTQHHHLSPIAPHHPRFHKMSTCKTLLRICSKQRQPSLTPLTQCRHESTTRRHKKLLALPEAPSYTSNRSEPTLIFNPPSSAPSVYHTPLKFLPKELVHCRSPHPTHHRLANSHISNRRCRHAFTHCLAPPAAPVKSLASTRARPI